jgi:sulfur-carrier protein
MAIVRFWAAARELAGTDHQAVDAGSVSDVLADVRQRHGERMARLLDVSVVLVDGVQSSAESDRIIAPDTVIEILPPYAGG